MGSAGLCARFHKAVELIGRRWSGAIIQILRQRPSRYAELRAAIPDITDRMLSERLRELEDETIVARTVIPETPVRVEYSLTSKGRALAPALDAIGHWAERWVEADPAKTLPTAGPAARPAHAGASRPSEPVTERGLSTASSPFLEQEGQEFRTTLGEKSNDTPLLIS
jgi:DNA-binding HxlR family transcriptional regulator